MLGLFGCDVVLVGLGYFYFLAAREPERNRITRFLVRSYQSGYRKDLPGGLLAIAASCWLTAAVMTWGFLVGFPGNTFFYTALAAVLICMAIAWRRLLEPGVRGYRSRGSGTTGHGHLPSAIEPVLAGLRDQRAGLH